MPSSAQEIVTMPQVDVDALFRASPAGAIPVGEGRGTVIYHPSTERAEIAEKLVHLIAWQGKVFDPEKGELRNKVSPLHLKAIRAKVYKDKSWFDGNEAIILDYSHTSLVAHWIRDGGVLGARPHPELRPAVPTPPLLRRAACRTRSPSP